MSKKTQKKKEKSFHTDKENRFAEWKEILRAPAGWIIGFTLALFASAAYSASFFSSTLITHDESILRAPLLSYIRNAPYLFTQDFMLYTTGQFRPISYVILAAARTFVSLEKVWFWHGLLLAFHILNTLLLLAVVKHFTTRISAAFVAAAVFALHPLATTVVNDVDRFYMLAGLALTLASLKSYFLFTQKGNRGWFVVAVGGCALALGTARPALGLLLFLPVYEIVYQGSRFRSVWRRLFPFVLIPILLYPIWAWNSPHPLHYKYVEMHEDSFWHGLFTFIGATGRYAGGFLWGRELPAPLHEVVEKIYSWKNPWFLLWASVACAVLVFALYQMKRKRWAALGILFSLFTVLPYASVAFNRVIEYVSWTYGYFPLAGFAWFMGGIVDRLWLLERRTLRLGTQAAVMLLVLFWGIKTVQLNRLARTPLGYWACIAKINPNSEVALYEIGKVYLDQRNLPYALHYFFSPVLKDFKRPCLAMARYYCRQGNYLASAIHLRYGSAEDKTGIILAPNCDVGGDLLAAVNALDHAEEYFGKMLMVNPYDTSAMIRLAQVFYRKGCIHEARRTLNLARRYTPSDTAITQAEETFNRAEKDWRDPARPVTVTPPTPDWLDYVLNQARSPELRRRIITLSDSADLNDGILQLEAVISHLENEEYALAAKKSEYVLRCLSGNAYACAAGCRALALTGQVEKAIQFGVRALSLDTQNTLAWESLALAHARNPKQDESTRQFLRSIEQSPAIAGEFYYQLGLQKKQAGLIEEAADLFEKSLQLRPNHMQTEQALGLVLLSLGKGEQAVEALRKALAQNVGDAALHAALGRAFIKQGKNEESVNALRTAVKIDPKNTEYHYYLGLALVESKKLEESSQEFRHVIELLPKSPDAHYELGNALAKMNRSTEAIPEYQKALALMPSYPYAHFNIATLLQMNNQPEEAIREYQEETRNNQKFVNAYNRLILLYGAKNDVTQARETAKQARSLGLQLNSDVTAILDKFSSK